MDEMHGFQKEMFSPRPEATFQVNFNAKTHLFNLKCKKTKNGCRLGEMHLFEFTVILYKLLSKKRLSPRRDAHSKLKKDSRLGKMHLFEFICI